MPRSNTKVRINLQGLKNNYYNYVQVFKEKDGCVEWIDAESKKRNQNEKKMNKNSGTEKVSKTKNRLHRLNSRLYVTEEKLNFGDWTKETI